MNPSVRFSAQRLALSAIGLVLLMFTLSVSVAHPAAHQDFLNKPVTLSVDNIQLKQVLILLENQTSAHFIHSPTAIQSERRVSVLAQNERLSVVLDRLLAPLAIRSEVVAGQILLQVKSENGVGGTGAPSGPTILARVALFAHASNQPSQ